MPAHSPEEIDTAFSEAFNAGDGEAVLALYEPGAVFVAPTGEPAEGTPAIAEVVGPFFAMKPRIDLRTERVLRSGDLAMVSSSWTVDGTGEDGSPVEMTGHSTVVVRRQPDGTWKFVLDDPGWSA
ncbi:MAG TPA: SgcJ/EcaC family oxidoreductase [Acidimicrobiia bacterium]|nr:SgcJ/EcaC family oxidoreductase [Acidimicrobiia bacterium]